MLILGRIEKPETLGEIGLEDAQTIVQQSETLFKRAKEDYILSLKVAREVAGLTRNGDANSSPFDRGEELGRGTFGIVYKAQERSTKLVYAEKHITAGSGSSKISNHSQVLDEINNMRKLSHLHITRLAFALKGTEGYSLYILPVADRNLDDLLAKPDTRFTNEQVLSWCGCLAAALDYAHRSRVKHKDIKPGNILLEASGNILLTDFGLAKDFSGQDESGSIASGYTGTRKYQAPECIKGGKHNQASDIFSLGCVYAEILNFLNGQTLYQFDKMRKDEWGSKVFRERHDRMAKWLQMREEKEESKAKRILLTTIPSMLKETVKVRIESHEIVQIFLGGHYREQLFCEMCSRKEPKNGG